MNIQDRNWQYGNTDDNLLFADSKIALKGELQWNGDLITQAILTLYNINSKIKFKICGVTKCAEDNDYAYPYILIHIAQNGTTFKSVFTASSSGLGSLSLPKGGKAHFLFKVHESCPRTLSCGFEDKSINPNSKDGSIIICI